MPPEDAYPDDPTELTRVNPTALAHRYGLRVRGKLITWEVFEDFLERKYWEERIKRTPTRSERERLRQEAS